MTKPSIGIDLGGTIEDSWSCKRTWFASRGFELGLLPRSRLDIIQSIGGKEALYQEMVGEVYSEGNIVSRKPVEGVGVALKTLAKHFRIHIVSSRPEPKRRTTITWLQRYGLWALVDEIALLGDNTRKWEWCLRAGVGTLVDDDPRHFKPKGKARQLTMIHFAPGPPLLPKRNSSVISVPTWEEIASTLKGGRRDGGGSSVRTINIK